jgi:hypothetical protein
MRLVERIGTGHDFLFRAGQLLADAPPGRVANSR